MRARRRPLPEVVDEVLERARGFGLPSFVWRVRLDSPGGVEQLLLERGGAIDETLDVFALDLTAGLPDLEGPDVELRWTTDAQTMHDSLGIGVAVFGGTMPPTARATADRLATLSGCASAGAVRSSPMSTVSPSAPEASRRADRWPGCGAARCSWASEVAGSTVPCSPPVWSTPPRTR